MDSNNVRRSSRRRTTTLKQNDYNESIESPKKEKTPKKEKSSPEQSCESGEEFLPVKMEVTDTVITYTPLPGKRIYSFDKVKKHERIISSSSTSQAEDKKEVIPRLLPKTPHNLRRNISKGISSITKNDDSSDEDAFADSGSEYSASESSSSSDSSSDNIKSEQESDRETSKKNAFSKKFSLMDINPKKQQQKTNSQYRIRTEEFFLNNALTKVTTSNHTLDKLKTPRLNQSELNKLLANIQLGGTHPHRKSIQNFSQSALHCFPKWFCLLHEDFNILLYGLGSKRNLLGAFHEELAKNGCTVIVINGFFPSLTLKDILDSIVSLLELNENPANVFDACEIISQEMALIADQHLYLIIHNIEGEMLRNNKSQSVLAKLAAVKNIHLLASIDHINAPLIWDHNKLSKFKFVWYDVTSYLPYSAETSFESSMMVQRTGNLALSSLRNIFLSLTSNSKGIYMIILKYQLENCTNHYYQGILFKDLYWACREAFLVSSDLALRAQLTEFTDHKMVKLKRSADGSEYLVIPIANNLLEQFLSEQDK